MAQDLTRSIKVYLDSSQYAQSLKSMEAALEGYRKKLDDLRAAGAAQKTSVDNLTVSLGAMKQQLAALEAAGKGESEQASELRVKISAYEGDLRKMNKTLADCSRETKRAETSLASFEKKVEAQRQKNEQLRQTLNNLSGATYNQLKVAQAALKRELRELVPGTERYNRTLELLRDTTVRLKAVDKQWNSDLAARQGLLSRAARAINRYALMMTASMTSLTALISAGRKAVAALRDIEEAMAKVRKYTGLTDEEVHKLNRSLGEINTRTSQLELEALAADAGRLGIKGVENLTRFVETADKIKIALGEDLGEDAVKNIGKLSQLFGEDKRLGLETAMMSSASAVTKLAKSSSASEPYLVEFASRLGGVGETAHITIADILGLGSALDQNMQKVEMSATALSTLIVNMAKDPAKFARLASLEVETFTKLVREDMNEAVITFIQKMNDRGGLMEIAPMFDEMNMSGKRAVQVLTTLAQHTDKIRIAQQQASEAYAENIEAQHEFDVMNNTLQAKREKHIKQIQALRVELGEKLQPVVASIYSLGTISLKIISETVTLIARYGTAIATATIALSAYTIMVNRAVIADKLKVFWTKTLEKSFRTLWATIKANPLGAFLTVLTIAVSFLRNYAKHTREVTVAQRSMNEIAKITADGMAEEAARIKILNDAIHNNALTYNQRLSALNELKKIVPDYHGALTKENTLINDNNTALTTYIDNLTKAIRLEAAKEELLKLTKEQMRLERELPGLQEEEEKSKRLWNSSKRETMFQAQQKLSTPGTRSIASNANAVDKSLEDAYNKARNVRIKTEEELRQYAAAIREITQQIEADGFFIATSSTGGGGGDDGGDDGGDVSTAFDILVEKYEGENGLITLLNEQYEDDKRNFERQLAQKLVTKEQYNVRMAELDRTHYEQLSGLFTSYHAEMSRVETDQEGQRTKKLRSIHREREKAADESAKARIRIEEVMQNSLKKLEEGRDLVSRRARPFDAVDNEYAQKQQSLEEYYQAVLAANEKLYQDEQERQAANLQAYQLYQQAMLALDQWYFDESDKLKRDSRRRAFQEERRELTAEEKWHGMLTQDSIASEYELKRKELDLYLKYKYMTEAEHERALRELRLSEARAYYDRLHSVASDAVAALQQAEIDAVEAKYEVLIRAAENNGEDTQALETEQANAKLEIQKKYALSNLVMKLSQITADTAVAIMTGFAQLGPVAGAVAATMLAATGAAQYVSALAEYNKVKAMSLSSGPSAGPAASAAPAAMERVVQYASGRYDVIGASDGKTYSHVPWVGRPQTGIVSQPALIAESGAELIVNATDLRRLQAHVNYGLVVDAINDARRGTVPQRAEGNYAALPPKASHVSGSDDTAVLERLDDIKALMRAWPTLLKAYVLLTDIDKAEDLRSRSEAPFTRRDKR
ncbi:MAG: phage tail tape measure protein [Bacteroidaceae bacterium]|nr:phage tail tape measure protein [Bacteroidaceae bacterium]